MSFLVVQKIMQTPHNLLPLLFQHLPLPHRIPMWTPQIFYFQKCPPLKRFLLAILWAAPSLGFLFFSFLLFFALLFLLLYIIILLDGMNYDATSCIIACTFLCHHYLFRLFLVNQSNLYIITLPCTFFYS